VVDAHLTLGIQLEKDSLKKSLKSQSSLGSCYSLAPKQVSLMFKWAKRALMDEVEEYKYTP